MLTRYRHGAQGQLDGASKSTLENEFGTKNEDEAIIKILEQGSLQVVDVRPTLPGTKMTRLIWNRIYPTIPVVEAIETKRWVHEWHTKEQDICITWRNMTAAVL